jgi:hypothetical protein
MSSIIQRSAIFNDKPVFLANAEELCDSEVG